METIEKRISKRLKINLPATFQSLGPNRNFGETVTRDISATGLRLNMDTFLAPDSQVLVRMRFPEVNKIAEGTAKVVWSHRISYSDKYQAGLQFTEINTVSKNWLLEYILINETLAK